MSFAESRLRAKAVAGAVLAVVGLTQPVAAVPISDLGPGTQYASASARADTFTIPADGEGVVFHLDPDELFTIIFKAYGGSEFTHICKKSGVEGWSWFARACAELAALHAHDADADEWQPNGWGSVSDDLTTQLVDGWGDDPVSRFQTNNLGNGSLLQTAYLGTDSPLGPASVPEPGSLLLLGSALLTFSIMTRRLSEAKPAGQQLPPLPGHDEIRVPLSASVQRRRQRAG